MTRPAVVNETEVRAAAGLTMAIGAVAFSYAYFAHQYVPLRIAATLLFCDFSVRVAVGLRYSPAGIIARMLTAGQPPEWVPATPKRFAWTLGLGMGLAMTVITNSGIRGPLPRTLCLICLSLTWMESVLGLCLGCKLHGLIVRRSSATNGSASRLCPDGTCEGAAQGRNESSSQHTSNSAGGTLAHN